MIIVDPQWWPDEGAIERLNRAVSEEIITGKSTEFTPSSRKALSADIGMNAVFALLAPVAKLVPVVDANTLRTNQPGYDILVGNQNPLKVQVKCCTYVDCIAWGHTPDNPDAPDLDFDVEIVVDAGCILDPRPAGTRSDGRQDIPMLPFVQFYIIPGDVVRAEVARGAHVNKAGARLYWYKRVIKKGTKEERCQWHDLPAWRNRFDVLDQMIASRLPAAVS